MNRLTRWFDEQEFRHRLGTILGYTILAVAVILAFRAQERDRREAKKQACLAVVDDRRTIADIVSFAVPRQALTNPQSADRAREFLDNTRQRLQSGLGICKGLDVDTNIDFPFPDALLEPRSGTTTTTTTTTTPAAAVNPSGVRVVPGPPVTVIVAVAGSSDRAGAPPGTTPGPSPPTTAVTTTTSPPVVCFIGLCLL